MIHGPLSRVLLPGERVFFDRVVSDRRNKQERMVYADWLAEQDDPRSDYLRQFSEAADHLDPDLFPEVEGLPESWLGWIEMLGAPLFAAVAKSEFENRDDVLDLALRLARPALRMTLVPVDEDNDIPVGHSKVGGLPDLASPKDWLVGRECPAIYNLSTESFEPLAGFLAQLNLAELSESIVGDLLPSDGVLSFFCFQDWENDNPDAVGVGAIFHPEPAVLRRTAPRESLTEGNTLLRPQQLQFQETLDLPDPWGPWADDLGKLKDAFLQTFETIHDRNFANVLGYGRATSGDDPTPNKDSRHLILLDNSYECRMHIQIPSHELAARNFSAITLDWVDFD